MSIIAIIAFYCFLILKTDNLLSPFIIENLLIIVAIVGINIAVILPYFRAFYNLSKYAKNLSLNRKVTAPDFADLLLIQSIANSLRLLQKSWQMKNNMLEEALVENKRLFNNLPEAIFIIDSHFVIVRSNYAAEEIFGKRIVGRNIADIINNSVLIGCIRLVLHSKVINSVDIEIPEIAKDFLVTVDHYSVSSNDSENTIVMMHDITKIKRVDKMFSDFIANASHEIRTPLTSVIGIIETLEECQWQDKEAIKTFTPMLLEQANRMKKLLNQLLNLSQIEQSLHTKPSNKVCLNDVINSVIRQIEWLALKRDIKIKNSLNGKEPLILGDDHQLSQVFYNLLSNSIKYGYSNSLITISATVTKNIPKKNNFDITKALKVSVKDQSEGIAKEHIDRLTEKFYNIDKSRSRSLGGFGLGLAITEQILKRHEALLQIQSTLGKGSVFTIYFLL